MKTTTLNNIIATARGTEILLPVITGQQSVTEWAQAIAKDSVTTKNGREISAARSALNGAQFAMTNVAMALRSATELGHVPFTQAVKETNRIYTLLDALRSAFSGVRNEAHRELTVAEVTLEVKDGVFDGLQSQSDEPYTEQELVDMGLGWDAIEEILLAQEAGMTMRQSDMGDSVDTWSEDEGEYRTSVHEAKQLWDMELKDIRYSESAAAAVALIGMDWPTANPMWEPLVERLESKWVEAISYADDKEAVTKKMEGRAQAIENLRSKPMKARWVVNHVCRRVFRDIIDLELRAEAANERLAQVERQAMNEERYNVPANLTRQGTGEHAEYDRKAFLLYVELDEAETAGKVEHDTQIERDRSWIEAQLEAIDGLVSKLQPLYQELRAMDLKLAKLWEIFTDGERPAEPPVYWNMQRAFLAGEEDAARDAIRVEAAMAKQKAREAEGDALVKAAALVEAMLAL